MESNSKHCFFLSSLFFLLLLNAASAKVHYHEFVVQEKEVKRLCNTSTIITVNGQFPGPTLEANKGDSFVIKVVNRVKYNVTIHWHGLRQMRNGWADGPAYVTQCPIKCGGTYTYRFSVESEEGTFFWHAHAPWLRVTVHGAIIIYPKLYSSYPFPKPRKEVPIILGEWWNMNNIQESKSNLENGGFPILSDAFLLNGQPGDHFECSSNETAVIPVTAGETILICFINAAMNVELFVSIAGHNMNVVAVDGSYIKSFNTSYLILGPGQTTDVLIHTNNSQGRYYIAAHPFANGFPTVPFLNSTATAILTYDTNIHSNPHWPILPTNVDKTSAFNFGLKLKSPGPVKIPEPIDENLTIVVGLHLVPGHKVNASMNDISFRAPGTDSILQAAYYNQPGVFTSDFPSHPAKKFNHTIKGTKIYKIKYGSVVQVVLQGGTTLVSEEHLIHLHGYAFYVMGRGIGDFVRERDEGKLNMVDPPLRNTVGVPAAGWTVIRFVADHPGVWLMHCHIELHFQWGMAMAFWVENGVGELESISPPPPDLPQC